MNRPTESYEEELSQMHRRERRVRQIAQKYHSLFMLFLMLFIVSVIVGIAAYGKYKHSAGAGKTAALANTAAANNEADIEEANVVYTANSEERYGIGQLANETTEEYIARLENQTVAMNNDWNAAFSGDSEGADADVLSNLQATENTTADSNTTTAASGTGADYESKYTDLYANEVSDPGRTLYLTFDDGPSSNTPEIMKILDEYGVKATYFVIYRSAAPYNTYYQLILDHGHALGIHTASHDYKYIYKNVNNYLKDFNKVWKYVKKKTGYSCKIFRFPGGSINGYNKSTYKQIIAEMERRGFVYFDWNLSGEDATTTATVKSIEKGILNYCPASGRKKPGIILLHDTKSKTVQALPTILKTLKERGYVFKTLDEDVTPVQFGR